MIDPLLMNEKTYRTIKRSYLKALALKKDTLDILDENGKPAILTAYAKYLLQYTEDKRKAMRLPIYEPSKFDKQCPKCRYQWVSRKENVVECPQCKTRIKPQNCIICGDPMTAMGNTCEKHHI
jgi:ribosomal protein L37AE/L43A